MFQTQLTIQLLSLKRLRFLIYTGFSILFIIAIWGENMSPIVGTVIKQEEEYKINLLVDLAGLETDGTVGGN